MRDPIRRWAVRFLTRARRTWAEIAYAERRLFELQTDISSSPTAHTGRSPTSPIDDLEALYALPAREPGHTNGREP